MALAAVLFSGCDGTPPQGATESKIRRTVQAVKEQPRPPVTASEAPPPEVASPLSDTAPPASPDLQTANRAFSDLARQAEGQAFESSSLILPAEAAAPPVIDEDLVAACGIRKIAGRHLTLYTDVPRSPPVEELPTVFDAAVSQWSKYFEVDARLDDWRMTGYLAQDKDRFRRARLWPEDLPPFLHGFQRGGELWLYEQPSDYYRRHLLLHEGTHAFMKQFLGGAGPPWYMEGMAELLATHRWENGVLTLRWFPVDKEFTAYWGRIKIVQDEIAAGRGRSLEEILQYDNTAHLHVEPYAWCWAAAVFFDAHPAYRDRFHELRKLAPDTSAAFSQRFHDALREGWPELSRAWQVFVVNLDYGYDLQREVIQTKPAQALPLDGAEVTIAADRGWQSTGYLLETGGTYQIDAVGRYQVGNQPKPWWCEPNGITIRYHKGAPLGMLLGAIVDEDAAVIGLTSLAKPDLIGLGGAAPVETGGTLFLRINDSPAELSDNAGSLTVRITRLE